MPIFSADDYFMVDGSYKFDPSKISGAHATCFARFLEALHDTRFEQVILMSGVPGSGKKDYRATDGKNPTRMMNGGRVS